jgi:hypothetical protein
MRRGNRSPRRSTEIEPMKLGFYIPVIGGANEKKWEQVVQTLAARAAPGWGAESENAKMKRLDRRNAGISNTSSGRRSA